MTQPDDNGDDITARVRASFLERQREARLRGREFYIEQWERRRLEETLQAAERLRSGMGEVSFKDQGRTPRVLRLSRGLIKATQRCNMPREGDWSTNAWVPFKTRSGESLVRGPAPAAVPLATGDVAAMRALLRDICANSDAHVAEIAGKRDDAGEALYQRAKALLAT